MTASPLAVALRAHLAPGGMVDLYAQDLATAADLRASSDRIKAARLAAAAALVDRELAALRLR